MAKEKKISIKYYLNKRVKPIDNEKYPIYVQISFDRKNTQFPYPSLGYISEKEFDDYFELDIDEDIKAARIDFQSIITASIRFEYRYKKDRFEIKGLIKRIDECYIVDVTFQSQKVIVKMISDYLNESDRLAIVEARGIELSLLPLRMAYEEVISNFKEWNDLEPTTISICVAIYSRILAYIQYILDEMGQDVMIIPVIHIMSKKFEANFSKFLQNDPDPKKYLGSDDKMMLTFWNRVQVDKSSLPFYLDIYRRSFMC